MTRTHKLYLFIAITVITTGVWAVAVDLPHRFAAGTTISSQQVNDNFDALDEGKQDVVTEACAEGSSIRVINPNGSVECEPDDTAGDGFAGVETINGMDGSVTLQAGDNISIDNDPNGQIVISANDIGTPGGDVVRYSENGNVGISTMHPSATLHVAGTRPAGDIAFRVGNGGDAGELLLELGWWRTGGPVLYLTDYDDPGRIYFQQTKNEIGSWIGQAGPNTSDLAIVPAQMINGEHLAIGNVGIGTVTPQRKLDVAGWVRAHALEITGGSDLAEPFEVTGNDTVEPGMVVAIDPGNPGQLRVADQAYDRTVAGIISGAGGVNPGMLMSQSGSELEGEHPVALTGRVYAWADATYGAIQPGDLLTTSPTPGHAMRVADYDQAQGATLGKAMTSLEEGQGLVLVLIRN